MFEIYFAAYVLCLAILGFLVQGALNTPENVDPRRNRNARRVVKDWAGV